MIPIIEKIFSVVFVITLLTVSLQCLPSSDLLGYLVMSGIDRIMGQSPAREVSIAHNQYIKIRFYSITMNTSIVV